MDGGKPLVSALAMLRSHTKHHHDSVDEAFSSFDLCDEDSYRAFLTAHSRVLPVMEAIMARLKALPRVRSRSPLLAADMAAMGQDLPPPMPYAGSTSGAAGWGILYVVEGSRLGGGFLATRVGNGLPKSYLAARHEPGEWRAVGQAIEDQASQHGTSWITEAVKAARACFDLYQSAAEQGGR